MPGFDLNAYRADYAALSADSAAPLLDRVCQGLYAPGSAFKPAVAAAALTAGIDPAATVSCTGRYGFYSGYQPAACSTATAALSICAPLWNTAATSFFTMSGGSWV